MQKKLEIIVTEGDIKRGKKMNIFTCPIAKAAKRALKYKVKLSVGGETLRFYTDKEYVIHLPKKAEKFILSFDKGEKVKPFKFVIRYGK